MISLHVVLRVVGDTREELRQAPLLAALLVGGVPLVLDLARKALRREFGSDLLAGISIVVSVILGEYLAGSLVVLMLAGGEALEAFAVRRASSVLQALAARMPAVAHRQIDSTLEDVPLDQVAIGDLVVVFPHEICPIDGTVVRGHGVMDESYLTGEPYRISKTPGATVLSGAINGELALTIRADRLAVDSRYAKIMEVMQASQQQRPRLRRLGDRLGMFYTPLAVTIALAAWALSGDPVRFLAVLVVATPCPLLIAIPVAIIGSISLAAQRAIIVRDPAALERVETCRTMIFDKTGTLTYGKPELVAQFTAQDREPHAVLALVSSLERYSKHPLAGAILAAASAAHVVQHEAQQMSEQPGAGLRGLVGDHEVHVTSRRQVLAQGLATEHALPPLAGGLECMIVIDGAYAATLQFRDTPRPDGAPFIQHLAERHGIERVMLVSGDRESEVRSLAARVGIEHVYFSQTPEQKMELTRTETARAATVFVGDGINDAPALMTATVGVAFGQHSEVTTEAAGVVILESSLERLDEFLHIGRRMRRIALQSAVGGMALSVVGMAAAAVGLLPPVAGALAQEVIDVFAVLNALRAAFPPATLIDYRPR